jgi:ABC-type multidrug transport system fused ATPase/permease subunit
LIAALVIASYFGLGLSLSLYALVCFLIGRVAWGFLSTLTSDLVNRMTTSDIRATVLSIRALGWRLLFAIVSPFIGYAADVWSIQQALLLTGILGSILLAITFLLMRSIWSRIPA